jgi:hypothetical protein
VFGANQGASGETMKTFFALAFAVVTALAVGAPLAAHAEIGELRVAWPSEIDKHGGYYFSLQCTPTPIPQSQADRDPVVQIDITWDYDERRNWVTLEVNHTHYSGHVSARSQQYTNFKFQSPPFAGTHRSINWDFWDFTWSGTNRVAPNMYIVGVVELAKRDVNVWTYQEFAKGLNDRRYNELISNSTCTQNINNTHPECHYEGSSKDPAC